ncbi:MAG TPA: hypothetical protein PKE47_10600 [Verrucomicrobiota bacterium]|nr:hypothetical protein [Verrucomicrobiota bacterium]
MDDRPKLLAKESARVGRVVCLSFAAVPLIWCLLMYAFVIHWRLFHGAWPDTRGKYTTIAVELVPLESMAGMGGVFLIFAFPVWAAFVLFVMRYVHLGPAKLRRTVFMFLPWLGVIVLSVIDPGGYIGWFFD